MSKSNKGARPNGQVGLFQMLRDVLIASINKGQFPIALLAIIAVVMLMRMPPEDIGKLVLRLLDAAERRWVVGYALCAVTALGWFFHARFQRRVIDGEVARVCDERTRLQQQALGNIVKSSEDKR